MNIKQEKILVILGPTATGKTDVALILAQKLNGAIIACDSRQVYKSLSIGSGKYPNNYKEVEKKDGYWIIDGIKVYLYDVVNPTEKYSVAQYVKDATNALEKIITEHKLPIIVGGTGLYLKALLEDLPNTEVPADNILRAKLEALSKLELQEKLQLMDINKWNLMNDSDRQNPRRLIRYIEIASSDITVNNEKPDLFDNVLKIGLTAPREFLYKKVDDRIENRLNSGMIEESENLIKDGVTSNRLKELGLEYGILADFLEGKIKDVDGDKGLIKIMQGKIHDYVRRQLTWFKKEKNVTWFDVSTHDYLEKIEKIVHEWYD